MSGDTAHGVNASLPTAAELARAKALVDEMAIEDGLVPWADPVDLFAQLSAPPFRASDAPAELSEYPRLFAEATGLDVSIMLTAACVVAAAAIPDQIQICGASDSSWFAQPRLWMLHIGAPGAGKTPGQREMLAPLWKLHTELDAEWRKAAKERPEEESKPARPRVVVGDATIEALSEVLTDNARGVLVAADEFDSWIGSLDQYRTGSVGRDRGEWLRLFDGGPHSIERISRGTVFVPNWGASILTATTPAAMQRLARHLPEDGLLQRFLIVIARRQRIELNQRPLREAMEAACKRYTETVRRLWTLTPRAHNGVVQLSADAKLRFDAWRVANSKLQEALGNLDSALEAHIAKYPTFALRLALTFHCAHIVQLEDPRARDPAAWALAPDTLERALSFLRRAEQHALAMYLGRKGGSAAFEVARSVARFIVARSAADNAKGLQRRDVLRYVVTFRSAEEREQWAALRLLMDLGWIRESEGGYQKAQPTRFEVSPYIAGKFAALAEREREGRALVRERLAEAVRQRREGNGNA